MRTIRHWTLGTKLALVAVPFLLLAMCAMGALLWMSWQLEGGAAAVNEAGRMRMQAFRLALSAHSGQGEDVNAQIAEFERSLALLHHGDPARPLFVPWNDNVRRGFNQVESDWTHFRKRVAPPAAPAAASTQLTTEAAAFTTHIDAWVATIEERLSYWAALMHLLQVAMLAAGVLGSALLAYLGYRFVLEPVGLFKEAVQGIQAGNFGARVQGSTTDEFGVLAAGFNRMAAELQSMYQGLEARVQEKTAQLEQEHGRLQSLYEVTSLIARATTLNELADGFTQRIAKIAHADGVALRWSDEGNRRYLMLASQGLPKAMTDGEDCLRAGDCHCGNPAAPRGARVIAISTTEPARMRYCAEANFQTVVSIPIRMQERLMGECDLFFHARVTLSEAERSLLESLVLHLAGAMENLRLNALGLEAAVSQERGLLARELHDSIAQSLAFLKIQVQLMRDALASCDQAQVQHVLAEIDAGVRESYGDVRELLIHFRTRTNTESIEPALRTTLRKFEQQTGLPTRLAMEGQGLPLAPDLQVQVLHIVQEALSNVRKHARATQVWLDVQQQPQWRFEVRDDGVGFDDLAAVRDEMRVGRRIMAERAQRLGASLDLHSRPGRGTSVVLTLPATRAASSPAAQAQLAA